MARHGSGKCNHRCVDTRSVSKSNPRRMSVASIWRTVNSRRCASSNASAVPSSIQRAAISVDSGGVIQHVARMAVAAAATISRGGIMKPTRRPGAKVFEVPVM